MTDLLPQFVAQVTVTEFRYVMDIFVGEYWVNGAYNELAQQVYQEFERDVRNGRPLSESIDFTLGRAYLLPDGETDYMTVSVHSPSKDDLKAVLRYFKETGRQFSEPLPVIDRMIDEARLDLGRE